MARIRSLSSAIAPFLRYPRDFTRGVVNQGHDSVRLIVYPLVALLQFCCWHEVLNAAMSAFAESIGGLPDGAIEW